MKVPEVDKNIFICGFMATGKSTLGRMISTKLNAAFIDLDQLIQKNEKRSINQIFRQEGESYFRKIEKETLYKLIEHYRGVISLGGGALQNQQVVDKIKNNGVLIYIHTPLEEIFERVYRRSHRPILFDESGKTKSKQILFDELKTLYFRREKYYRQAHFSLNSTDFSSPEEMAAAAIKKLLTV